MKDGELPTCYGDDNGHWTVRYPGGSGSSDAGWIVGPLVLAALIGGGVIAYRVSTARDIARRAGMDERRAATTALLSPNGLDATYVAAGLRQQKQTRQLAPLKPTEDRLAELQQLLDEGLVSQAEYTDRRHAILGDV